ncbi:MAG: DinB family protein [Acidobacteria bacterium]|nr:MAG: DinB family protein [Acidobacteriota bacterium]
MTKRLAALTVLGVTLSVLPVSAQPLTRQERDSLVQHLEQTRQAFLQSISGLSDAQWTFKAGPDRWSIAEVAEHIAISETTIFQLVTDKMLTGPAIPPNPTPVSDEKLLASLLDRSTKFQAPEMLKPTNRWATREALTKDFLAARDKTITYVKTTTDDLHGHGGPHPVFKMLDGYQWVLLISGHSARHTAQIEEVKASPGYPAR